MTLTKQLDLPGHQCPDHQQAAECQQPPRLHEQADDEQQQAEAANPGIAFFIHVSSML